MKDSKMVIEIHFLPPAKLSPNARVHWSERSPVAAAFREVVRIYCIDRRNREKKWTPFARPVMNLTFVFDKNRRRDEDNMRARFKPGLDGMVDAGLLLDDNPGRLITGSLTMLVDKDRAPMTIIELKEVT